MSDNANPLGWPTTPFRAVSANEGSPMSAEALIQKIAQVSAAIGWQAGVDATGLAGMIVSCLAEKPELIGRFMVEGGGLMIDGHIATELGCLTYTAMNGDIMTPQELRVHKQVRAIIKDAGRQAP